MRLIPDNLVLENDRVQLRKLVREDLLLLLPYAISEPNLWQFSLQNAAGEAGMKEYIQLALADFESGFAYPFIVFDKVQRAYAGSTRFYDISADHKTLQLGYTWYGKDFQGTGLNKNCKYLLLSFAFDSLGFERVEFRADAGNSRSIAAMRSIGCTAEGILRSHLAKPGGGRRDSIVLSILKDEWEERVKMELKQKIENLL
jgi:RimJ/RimL family protein N-acetyltransferase